MTKNVYVRSVIEMFMVIPYSRYNFIFWDLFIGLSWNIVSWEWKEGMLEWYSVGFPGNEIVFKFEIPGACPFLIFISSWVLNVNLIDRTNNVLLCYPFVV